MARLLDQHAFPHAVVGALGLHAYGHSRATFDSAGYSNHHHADPDWGGLDVI